MKARYFATIAVGILMTVQAHATVLGFDDLDAKGKLASIGANSPYGGLTWDKNWFLGVTTVGGYGNAAHSGANFVNNGFGVKSLAVSSSTGFDFAGAWFAAPNINGTRATSINISAYDAANQLIGTTGDVAITNSMAFVAARFDDVARLVITRDKGFFVMDDFTLADTPLPEPGGMFALGLGLVGWMGRRRAART